MKLLTRIVFVNWYLFEAVEWKIKGHVALVGKNGTGKSSFIDAIQLIMLGGSRSDWSPNAKASNKHHTRSIRSYVLGLVKDEQAIGNSKVYQPREDALSRIVLVYEDDQTGEVISVGGAFSARRDDPDAEVEGYFIAHGVDISLSNLLDHDNHVKSYLDLKTYLKVSTNTDQLYLFAHEPKKFMEQMMHSLGPVNRPTVLTKVRRAFKQSINLSGLEGSVSEFVKSSILDPEPLNLVQVRQSIESYQHKQQAVSKIKSQIESLTEIDALFKKAKSAGVLKVGHSWCAEELRYCGLVQQSDEIKELLIGYYQTYSELREVLKLEAEQIEEQNSQLEEINIALNGDKAVSQQAKLKERHASTIKELQHSESQKLATKLNIGYVTEVAKYKDYLGEKFSGILDFLAKATYEDLHWPESPIEIDTVTDELKSLLPNEMSLIELSKDEITILLDKTRTAYGENSEKLVRLESGKTDLNNNTIKLIGLLKGAGIEAIPVCELVTVSELEWQPAIEAYLRNNTEALIVPPEHAQKAVEIYRAAKKENIYGATVVNTARVQDWQELAEAGTAAQLIQSDNVLALNYLRRLLNGVRLSDKTESLMKENRALTKDGMFISQVGIKRLKLPVTPKLGKNAREQQIKHLKLVIADQREQLGELQNKHGEYRNLNNNLTTLHTKLDGSLSLERIILKETKLRRQITALETQIEAVDTSHVEELKKQQTLMAEQLKLLNKSLERNKRRHIEARTSFKLKNKERRKLDRVLPSIADERKKIENTNEGYDAERTSQMFEQLEEMNDLENPQILETAVRKQMELAESAAKKQQKNENDAREKLGTYLVKYPIDGFWRDASTTLAGTRVEVDRVLHQLIDTGLHKREKEVSEALYQVQKIIRSDLAIRLRGHINNMKRRISELNRELNERPFSSNQKYKFHYERLPEFRELLTFIESADEESVSNTNSLFDEFSHLDAWVEKILAEDSSEILADYRNYFHFDIAIKDEKEGITEMLSRKMGSASGGEHRTPFYVAMGASLASAYRLERQHDDSIDGGVSLYLADEAFEKMDRANTLQAAGYLKSIGLQLFVATPDDAEPRLREVVDTVMYFIREGAQATIDVDYVMPKARQLLAEVSKPIHEKALVE